MCCSNSSFNTRKDVMPCPNCDPCLERWRDAIHYAVRLSGGFGLVFSFTQVSYNNVILFNYNFGLDYWNYINNEISQ